MKYFDILFLLGIFAAAMLGYGCSVLVRKLSHPDSAGANEFFVWLLYTAALFCLTCSVFRHLGLLPPIQ